MAIKIPSSTLALLAACACSGPNLTIAEQLNRDDYQALNKVLEAAGGKWNRKAKAHTFDGDAYEAIEPIILTGEYSRTKQDFGQFDTPIDLAASAVAAANIEPGMTVYEPSCGVGNLIAEIVKYTNPAKVFGNEIDPKRHQTCVSNHFSAFGAGGIGVGDFLLVTPIPTFDRVVMNPPFAKQADIDHVLHAHKFLKPGGLLVAIMSASVSFRTNTKTAAFRQFVESCGGLIEPLPTDSFKVSGTAVNTVLVHIPA